MRKYLAEEGAIVMIAQPVDINSAGIASDWFSMENWDHATIEIFNGTQGGTPAITLDQAKTAAGGSTKTLGFESIYINLDTTASSVLTKAAVTSDSYTITAVTNALYVIEIDAAFLDRDNDFKFIQVAVSDPSAAAVMGVKVTLTGGRYQGAAVANVLA